MTRALKELIGVATEPVRVEVERGQIRRFARAIGETNQIHFDPEVARAAGFRDLAAPPSFLLALYDLESYYAQLGVNSQTTMHAEEEYEYFMSVCAGDAVNLTHTVVDAYETKAPNGSLMFIVIETRAVNDEKTPICKGRRVLVDMRV